jgi:hypothetical protein
MFNSSSSEDSSKELVVSQAPVEALVESEPSFDDLYAAQEALESRRQVVERANAAIAARETRTFSRAATYANLTASLPTNDLGLPTYLYRPDLIPPDLDTYTGEQRTAILQAASIEISFDQGFPTLETGATLWSRFPWEPADAFEMFQRYVDMPTLHAEAGGPGIDAGVESGRAAIQIAVRDISTLAEIYQPIPGSRQAREFQDRSKYVAYIREMATLYCWPMRVKAYDLFIAAAYRKWREQQTYALEQKHYRSADALLSRAQKELIARMDDPERMVDIKEKDLLDMITKMMQIQRISLGLSVAGGGKDETTPKNASLELTLRTIAKGAGEEARQMQDDESIQALLDDPDALVKAQELIIRMNTPVR